MRYYTSTLFRPAFFGIAVLLSSGLAAAQITPGGMPMGGGAGGMGGGQQPSGEEKKEGVGEAAPKTPGLLPTTPALPAPKGHRKRWKLLELDGYYRMRTDWFKNFNTGFQYSPTPSTATGGAPFPNALGCTPATSGAGASADRPCNDSLASTNMRLRLEPTINLDEGTSVHIQADALDNLVLGSTPYSNDYSGQYTSGLAPPLGAFSNNQAAVTQGQNSDRPSVTVKRAWGEIALPIGVLKFGRMPNQWGMGINHNAGGYDPITGNTNYDADYGDTVDRVSFSAQIPGTNLRAMVAADWASVGLVSNQTSANLGNEGHPFDLDDSDDRNGWVGVISKMDSPQDFKDTVDRGDLAYNYGVYFEYLTQSWDTDLSGFTLGGTLDASTKYLPRDMKTYTPDLWGKVGYGPFLVEGEFVASLGTVDRLDQVGLVDGAAIRKFGGVVRATWTGVENKLRIGLEAGFATGDQWDNTSAAGGGCSQGNLNVACSNPLGGPGDTSLTQFIFNRDYQVDMILWRRLAGAVTNAFYFKPFMSFDIIKQVTFKVANVSSFAMKPIATPGNGAMYGTEFDTDLGYHEGGLWGGLSFGVLFPFSALSHPVDDSTLGGAGFGYGTNTGDATTAYCIQTRLVLAF
jgi:uncharacterized protein (TIGR04551 family)